MSGEALNTLLPLGHQEVGSLLPPLIRWVPGALTSPTTSLWFTSNWGIWLPAHSPSVRGWKSTAPPRPTGWEIPQLSRACRGAGRPMRRNLLSTPRLQTAPAQVQLISRDIPLHTALLATSSRNSQCEGHLLQVSLSWNAFFCPLDFPSSVSVCLSLNGDSFRADLGQVSVHPLV
jgi:hypothetical protein